jgi:hypothetical protein
MKGWGVLYWPYWIIVAAFTFAIAETYALVTKDYPDTLSDYARTQLHIGIGFANNGIHTIAWWASFLVWVVFVVWITPHIWFIKFG